MLFKGVATALVTPMRDGKIDYDKMCELIDWQISCNVSGIVLGIITMATAIHNFHL